ncbi:MAG: hypothetical protein IJ695_04420 [Butyrivibrio sp.]|nr:hypothetical protein [Butyrivibrio sp.]
MALEMSFSLCSCGNNSDSDEYVSETEESADMTVSEPEKEPIYPYSAAVFSWDHLPDKEEIEFLLDSGITEVYQYIKPDYKKKQIYSFLVDMKRAGIDVYYLDGEPEWSKKEQLDTAKSVVDRVLEYNKKLNDGEGFRGIIYDVEPYTLKEWRDMRQDLLFEYSEVVASVCSYANEKNTDLKIGVCIPYYYDELGFEGLIKDVAKASDKVIVLNYYKNKEIDHIETELSICEENGAEIVSAYELQPTRLSFLDDTITYYSNGYDALDKSYRDLLKAYPKSQVSVAFHTMEFFKELFEGR